MRKYKPKLTVLVGLPCSGKSEYAEQLAEETGAMVISASFIREMIHENKDDIDHNKETFSEIYDAIKNCLLCRESVIFDATNMASRHRKSLCNFLSKVDCIKECIVIARPVEDCLAINAQKDNPVKESVIHRMASNFSFPWYFEGFDDIKIYYPNPDDQVKYGYPKEFIAKYSDFNQCNHHHTMTLGVHAYEVFKKVIDGDMTLAHAALLHDCGKPFTQTFEDKTGKTVRNARYPNHAGRGAYESLFYNVYDRHVVPLLITYHMMPYQFNDDKQIAMWKERLGEDIYSKLVKLNKADEEAH